MASKIAKWVAEDIAGKMTAATYDPLMTLHKGVADALIEKLLNQHYGALYLQTFRGLPKAFHTRVSRVYVTVRGAQYELTGNDEHVAPKDHAYNSALWLKLDDPLEKEVEAWIHEKDRLNKERKETRSKIIAAIQAFGTPKKLREGWPEAAKFLPSDDRVVNLPMVPVNDIMSTLRNAKTPQDAA